jgi:hypothetical protein
LWVARAAPHAIRAIFPPLDTEGGKGSVSEKKLRKGDARFKTREVLLGFLPSGSSGPDRTVAVPTDKFDRCATGRLEAALSQRRNWIPLVKFQKIHGQVHHMATALLCL